jgi:hypothetical protein
MTQPHNEARDPTALAERHHGTSHMCPTMSQEGPRSTTHGTVWNNVGHEGSIKYIDLNNEPLWLIVFKLVC